MLLSYLLLPTLMSFEIPLSQNDVLQLVKPKGYIYRISKNAADPENQKKSALQFSYFNNVGYKSFVFRIFIYRDPENYVNNATNAKSYIRDYCKNYQNNSIENQVIIRTKSRGRGDYVYYCSFTDSTISKRGKVKPGQFRNISLAMVRQNGYVFIAVAYSNSLSGKLYKRYLNTLASIKIKNK